MPGKTILYVEDEETDIMLMECALKKAQISTPLATVKHGDDAVAYFMGKDQYADRVQHPLPGLVLLDLNLPRLSGMKVLQWIREQPHFASLPVVIYTSAEDPKQQEEAKRLGATDYIVKPPFVDKIA